MEANWKAVAVTAVAPIAWGSTYFVTRHWLPADVPLFGAALRALPAGLLLVALRPARPHGSWWWRTAVIALLTVGGFFVLVYVAGSRLPSGVAATLMATSAVGTMLFGWALLGERPRAHRWLGAGLGLIGVLGLLSTSAVRLDTVGVIASLLGMGSSSLGFVLTKRWAPPVPPLTFAGWQLTVGGLMIAPVAVLVEGTPPPLSSSQLVAFGYLIVVATAVAYAAWFFGLRQLEAGAVGIVGLLNPLTGALLGIAFGGETFTVLQTAGAALVLVGVVIGVVGTPRLRRVAPQATPAAACPPD